MLFPAHLSSAYGTVPCASSLTQASQKNHELKLDISSNKHSQKNQHSMGQIHSPYFHFFALNLTCIICTFKLVIRPCSGLAFPLSCFFD